MVGGGWWGVQKLFYFSLSFVRPHDTQSAKGPPSRRRSSKKEKGKKKKGNNTVTEPIWSSLFVRKHR